MSRPDAAGGRIRRNPKGRAEFARLGRRGMWEFFNSLLTLRLAFTFAVAIAGSGTAIPAAPTAGVTAETAP